jgi:galactose mutarotase-like enzyme
MTIIENDYLRLTAQVKGAELTSIFDKERKIEYLWQADTKHWGRHAPVLFPIVGRLQENSFSYNGNSYSMNQHGIARDMNFQVLEKHLNFFLFTSTYELDIL